MRLFNAVFLLIACLFVSVRAFAATAITSPLAIEVQPGQKIQISGTYDKKGAACLVPIGLSDGAISVGLETTPFTPRTQNDYVLILLQIVELTDPCSSTAGWKAEFVVPAEVVQGTTVATRIKFTEYSAKTSYNSTTVNSVSIKVADSYTVPPIANDQAVVVSYQTPKTFTANVSPSFSGATQVKLLSQPANGVASVSGTSITYTPNAGYVGNDLIRYSAVNQYGESNVAGIGLEVVPASVNNAYHVIRFTGENSSKNEIEAEIDSTVNINHFLTSPWGNTCTTSAMVDWNAQYLEIGTAASVNGQPFDQGSGWPVAGCKSLREHSTSVVTNSVGTWMNPAALKVGDVLKIRPYKNAYKSGGFGGGGGYTLYKAVGSHELTIKVIAKRPPNSPPVMTGSSVNIPEDGSANVTLNGTDPDAGDILTYKIDTSVPPSVGSAVIAGNKLAFTPSANWNGQAVFKVYAEDSKGVKSNIVNVEVNVLPSNDTPAVNDVLLSTSEDAVVTTTLGVSDVDLGREGDSHTWSIVTSPNASHGTAAVIGSTLTFTPAPNWSGTTTLTYRAKDSANAFSNTATVTVTVNPVNDAPVAQAKTIVTDEDTPDTVTLTATDIDSPAPSTFQVVTNPAHGTASISGNVLTYTPPANWSGSTSLTYRAQDSGGAWSAPATVSITVNPINDVPVVQAKSITAAEDSSGSVMLTVTDPDISYGDSHTFEIVSAPNASHGSASISGSTLTFTPAADWNGSTSLTYRARDEAGAYSAPATVSITITAVNDAPVAAAKASTTNEDTPAVITLSAADIDSPVPTVYQVVAAPNASYGSVSLSGSGATFTPAANWHGTATFTYRAQDGQGAWSAPATVTVTVVPVNDAPSTGSSLNIKTIEGEAVTVKFILGVQN